MHLARAEYNGVELRISIARGSASFNKEDKTSYSDVFQMADQAMYENKVYIKEKVHTSLKSQVAMT